MENQTVKKTEAYLWEYVIKTFSEKPVPMLNGYIHYMYTLFKRKSSHQLSLHLVSLYNFGKHSRTVSGEINRVVERMTSLRKNLSRWDTVDKFLHLPFRFQPIIPDPNEQTKTEANVVVDVAKTEKIELDACKINCGQMKDVEMDETNNSNQVEASNSCHDTSQNKSSVDDWSYTIEKIKWETSSESDVSDEQMEMETDAQKIVVTPDQNKPVKEEFPKINKTSSSSSLNNIKCSCCKNKQPEINKLKALHSELHHKNKQLKRREYKSRKLNELWKSKHKQMKQECAKKRMSIVEEIYMKEIKSLRISIAHMRNRNATQMEKHVSHMKLKDQEIERLNFDLKKCRDVMNELIKENHNLICLNLDKRDDELDEEMATRHDKDYYKCI